MKQTVKKAFRKDPAPAAEIFLYLPKKNIILLAATVFATLTAEGGICLFNLKMQYAAIAVFAAAFAGFLAILYMSAYSVESMPLFTYKKEKKSYTLIKSVMLVIFAILASFFMHNRLPILGITAYLASFLQLMFIFRYSGTAITLQETPSLNTMPEFRQTAGIHGHDETGPRLCLFAALVIFVVFIYFCLKELQHYSLNAAFLCFTAASAALFLARKISGKLGSASGYKFSPAVDYIFLALIVCAAFYLRAVRIADIPPGASMEEALAIHIVNIINSGAQVPVFLHDVLFQVSSFYYYILAIYTKFFALSITNIRMLSVAGGSLGVIFIYLLGRELYGRRTGLLASLFMAVSCVHLIYSTVAWLWIFVPLFASAAFYFYLVGERKGKTIYFVMSGLMLGIGLYYYNAAKLAPFVLAAYWIALFIKKDTRPFIVNNFRSLSAVVIMAVVIFLPVLQYAVAHPDLYFAGIKTQSVFRGHEQEFFSPNFQLSFSKHILDVFLMFTTKSSKYGYFNYPLKPLLDPLSSFFLLTGLAVILGGIRKKNNIFMLIFLAAAIYPAVMSFHGEDPNTQRAILVIPAVILAAAAGFDALLSFLEKSCGKASAIAVPVIVATAMLFISFDNLDTFFNFYPKDRDVQTSYLIEQKISSDEAVKAPDKMKYFSIFYRNMLYFGPLISVAHNDNLVYNDISRLELHNFYNNKKMDVLIMGEGIYNDYINIFREYFPNTVIKRKWNLLYRGSDPARHYVFRDREEPALFYSEAEIPYSDIKNLYTLRARIDKTDGPAQEALLESASISTAGIKSISLSSLIDIPYFAEYRFSCDGGFATFTIDGKQVKNTLRLYKGLHRFRAELSNFNGPETSLKWEIPGKQSTSVIPINYFINSGKIFGLHSEYRDKGVLISEQLDPALSFRLYDSEHRMPGHFDFDAIWTGNITLPENGAYSFTVKTPFPAVIYIDGSKVFERTEDLENAPTTLKLSAGKHAIKVLCGFRNMTHGHYDPRVIQLLYKRSGENLYRQVPYSMLSY
jgi:4-amino-4-deoxy-L-arabinose transferase-like glycosyltransferase